MTQDYGREFAERFGAEWQDYAARVYAYTPHRPPGADRPSTEPGPRERDHDAHT